MEIQVGEYSGFCIGVKRAVDMAFANAGQDVYVLGELIHNASVVRKIRECGIITVDSVEDVPCGTLIIRSHGVAKNILARAEEKGLCVIDATCPFVKKVHNTVEKYYALGYQVVIIGEAEHPEVVGINGWCENSAIIFNDKERQLRLENCEKVCIVAQTTTNPEDFDKILKNIVRDKCKIVEVFNTICYTTIERNLEAVRLAEKSDAVVVIGGRNSSNTRKLYLSCQEKCKEVTWVEGADEIDVKQFKKYNKVTIVAGASTPSELIKEVKLAMSEIMNDQVVEDANGTCEVAVTATEEIVTTVPVEEVAEQVAPQETEAVLSENITMEDVMKGLSQKKPVIRRGQVLKTTIVMVTDEGVMLQNGAKGELLLPKAEASLTEEFDKSKFVPGDELEVVVISTDPLIVSRKAMLLNAIEDEKISELSGGAEFKVKIDGSNKGGLTGKLGSYSVFVPSSQIRMGYVKQEDLEKYVGKELRLQAIKIEKRNITGSARPIIEAERAVKEAERAKFLGEFFSSIEVGQIVEGKVVRFAAFGAFVNVNGFDCLAHISDLAWTNVKKADDILKKDEIYEFVVLKVDAENQRVSIGYKQLQPKPWDLAAEKYPEGSIITGKVVRIAGFGAFVEVEPGIDGLVHVSQISHEWIENPTSALKVGEEVTVKVLEIHPEEEKLTLSIKALTPEPENKEYTRHAKTEEGGEEGSAAASDRIQKFEKRGERFEQNKERRERRPRSDENNEPREWVSNDNNGASIGELLKGLDLKIDE